MFDRRDFDLVVFADQFQVGVRRHGGAAELAMHWPVVADFIGIVGEPAIARLVTRLRPARPGIFTLLFLVGRRWFRRSARGFVGPLKLQHQINQLLFAELLQITPIHADMDSEFPALGKGRGKDRLPPSKRKMTVGNYHASVAHRPVLVLRYEDILASPVVSFGRVAVFVNLKPELAQLRRAIAHSSFENSKSRKQNTVSENAPQMRKDFSVLENPASGWTS